MKEMLFIIIMIVCYSFSKFLIGIINILATETFLKTLIFTSLY